MIAPVPVQCFSITLTHKPAQAEKISKFKKLQSTQYFFSIILIHANVQCACIAKTKCQVDPLKVSARVWTIIAKALIIDKSEKISKFLSILICLKTNSFMHMFNVFTFNGQSVKLNHQRLC